MNHLLASLLLLGFVAPIGAAQPAFTNAPRPRVVSPEVQPDRRVIFRIWAPAVTNVTVSGDWGGMPASLSMETNGVWSGTVGPLDPELYSYSFTVNGVQMLDPSNLQVKPMRSFGTSILDVRGPGLTVRDFDPAISHGVVRQHTYYSKALKQTRSLHVYTPPGYDQKRFSKFPVLYLFHGAGDNDATWTSVGRAQWILDNLIAQGKAKPMIIVMTDGHAFVPTGGRPDPGMFLKGVHVFEEDLLGDVLPFVEKNYRARSGSKNRAIAGLSMGGGQSLVIGLNHTDKFAWVAGFSSFVPQPEESVASALADGAQTNKRLKLLWIACGKDDFLLERNKPLDQTLTSHGVSHVFKITEGNHTWPVWRRYLAEVAPQLF